MPFEKMRYAARCDLARVEASDGALAGALPDRLGGFEIARMACRGLVVIALHRGALARDRLDRDAVMGTEIGTAKSAAGDEHHAADASGRRCAAGLGDAADGERGRLGDAGEFLKRSDRRPRPIEEIEIRKIAGDEPRLGEPGEAVFRSGPRHGEGAFGERIGAVAAEIICRHHGLAPADKGAQADIVGLGALGFLDRSVANRDRLRQAADRKRVRRIGAGAQRRSHQPFGGGGEAGLVEWTRHRLRASVCTAPEWAQSRAETREIERFRQPLVNHRTQSTPEHRRLTNPFKQIGARLR
jgi:hypothetical protein